MADSTDLPVEELMGLAMCATVGAVFDAEGVVGKVDEDAEDEGIEFCIEAMGALVSEGRVVTACCAQTGFPAIPGSSDILGTGLFSPFNHADASSPGVVDFVSGYRSAWKSR